VEGLPVRPDGFPRVGISKPCARTIDPIRISELFQWLDRRPAFFGTLLSPAHDRPGPTVAQRLDSLDIMLSPADDNEVGGANPAVQRAESSRLWL